MEESEYRQGNGPARGKALVIDQDRVHARLLTDSLAACGLNVELCSTVSQSAIKLSRRDSNYDLVVINVSDMAQPWLRILHALREAFGKSGKSDGPQYLCVSTKKRDPYFELEIE